MDIKEFVESLVGKEVVETIASDCAFALLFDGGVVMFVGDGTSSAYVGEDWESVWEGTKKGFEDDTIQTVD